MIYDIFFDTLHDLTLDGSDLKFATEEDIVKQRLTIRLQFLLEEWFLDATAGLPYTQFIFKQGSSIDIIYSLFRQHILATEGVESIEKLELTPTPSNKGLAIELEVNNGIAIVLEVS